MYWASSPCLSSDYFEGIVESFSESFLVSVSFWSKEVVSRTTQVATLASNTTIIIVIFAKVNSNVVGIYVQHGQGHSEVEAQAVRAVVFHAPIIPKKRALVKGTL